MDLDKKAQDANRKSVIAIIARSAMQDAIATLLNKDSLLKVDLDQLAKKIKEQAESLYKQMKMDAEISLKKGGGQNLRMLFYSKIKAIGVYEANQAMKKLK